MSYTSYESVLGGRYASKEMQAVFSAQNRYSTWRKIWVALAESENELGLPVTAAQIEQLKQNTDDIDFARVAEIEKQTRHDVMAHIRAYGEKCPDAAGIIHLGATSCFVTDNADIILIRRAFALIRDKLVTVIRNLAAFADSYKGLPCLAYTHLQSAQPTTVGKRAALWLQDFTIDYGDLRYVADRLRLLGNKGATGTQASFLRLFEGDAEKVLELERRIARKLGFDGVFPVSGQTYTRKEDMRVQNVLSGIAQSAYKFADDMRLLQSFGELEEPFGKNQVGSSAMAYKRNPMRCERICSLARFVTANSLNAPMTASTQWLERTLDDSANRRLSISEGFLAVDAILNVLIDVTSGITVYPKISEKRLRSQLPYIATENILMEAVKKGGDRQKLHEKIRQYSVQAETHYKQTGEETDLIGMIAADPDFLITRGEIETLLDPVAFVGLAPLQTERFLADHVKPILDENTGVSVGAVLEV